MLESLYKFEYPTGGTGVTCGIGFANEGGPV
jgi:hypothetical protein